MTDAPLTIAFVSDPGMFLPGLRAMDAALRHVSGGVDVLFLGSNLTPQMWDWLAQVASKHPKSNLRAEVLPDEWLAGAHSPQSFITSTALGRMFLPRLTTGRVLYLDGDILVSGDLSGAATLDMQGQLIAGVRDFSVMKWVSQGRPHAALQRQIDVMPEGMDMTGYINAGILLLDVDAIRASEGVIDQMEDLIAVQGYPMFDQDRINVIFQDRITHLDPVWNCSWGRLKMQRKHQAGLPLIVPEPHPLLVHFHGPHKPWQKIRMSSLSRNAWAVWQYRRDMATFRSRFPNIPDHLPK
jgi:lipopolysaccharide biosynthesis glycosyltransferase